VDAPFGCTCLRLKAGREERETSNQVRPEVLWTSIRSDGLRWKSHGESAFGEAVPLGGKRTSWAGGNNGLKPAKQVHQPVSAGVWLETGATE